MTGWILKAFQDLTPQELYTIIRLRNEVFVVEQNCVFQDADNNDQHAHHLYLSIDDSIAAYARLLPPDTVYQQASIGRVITAPGHRARGLGRTLVQESIDRIYTCFGKQPIKIGAQYHLKKFYGSFGFQQLGEVYDEDGIDHIHMLKP